MPRTGKKAARTVTMVWRHAKTRIVSELILSPVTVFFWVFRGISDELLFGNLVALLFGRSPQMTNLDILATSLRLFFATLLSLVVLGIGLSIYFDVREKERRTRLGKKAIPIIKRIRDTFNAYMCDFRGIVNSVKGLAPDGYAVQLSNNSDYLNLLESGTSKTDATIEVLSRLEVNPQLEKVAHNGNLPELRQRIFQDLVRVKLLETKKGLIKTINKFEGDLARYFDECFRAADIEVCRELFRVYYSHVETNDIRIISRLQSRENNQKSLNDVYILNFFDLLEDLWKVE